MTLEMAVPAAGARGRERHVLPVRAVRRAWDETPEETRRTLRRTLPAPLTTALLRLVDPHGLHGHSDASALAEAFRRLGEDEVEALSGAMPFSLFWAVARLSQNLY
ncbi:hypothetical protein [Nocardioides campestrisoli]|uniref:hypothetical protein n=1 Tax=Nocardioides campestrisoli TaxID=2736757 RepID=UPI00163DB780|nr:hypothetical protein [Nocardioides campestrisoli]